MLSPLCFSPLEQACVSPRTKHLLCRLELTSRPGCIPLQPNSLILFCLMLVITQLATKIDPKDYTCAIKCVMKYISLYLIWYNMHVCKELWEE